MNKKIKLLLSLLFATGISYAEGGGFYVGAGSGINDTFISNSVVSYNENGAQKVYPQGNVSATSVPISIDFGYSFNNFLAAELLYSYSGNQTYPNLPGGGTYSGTQNTISLSAVGFWPVLSNIWLKGRIGLAGQQVNLTNYMGNANSTGLTSAIGAGVEYKIIKNISVDLDYVNYGLINPVNLNYQPCSTCTNIGSAGSEMSNLYLLSLQYHF